MNASFRLEQEPAPSRGRNRSRIGALQRTKIAQVLHVRSESTLVRRVLLRIERLRFYRLVFSTQFFRPLRETLACVVLGSVDRLPDRQTAPAVERGLINRRIAMQLTGVGGAAKGTRRLGRWVSQNVTSRQTATTRGEC